MRRIVVASCDAKFYPLAREMYASVINTSAGVVDEMVFFDLGLSTEQRREMEGSAGVLVQDYPAWLTAEVYADFLAPRTFAWKTYALRVASKYGDSILYMDCGCIALNSLRPIFELIERDDAFFVQDDHRNFERTHEQCLSIMQATAAERAASQLDAGVVGYRVDGKFTPLFEKGFEFAKNRACIAGEGVHRHDQSIYSILASRYNVTIMHPYGGEVHWQGIQTRDQIIWQHRGKWPAFKRLRERAMAAVAGRRIAVYGAGKHTERFLATLRNLLEPRHRIVGIVDDTPRTQAMDGLRVVRTDEWLKVAPDLVIVSSDAHEAAMIEKGRGIFQGVEVWGIYGDR